MKAVEDSCNPTVDIACITFTRLDKGPDKNKKVGHGQRIVQGHLIDYLLR